MPKEMLIWHKETWRIKKEYKSRPNNRFGFKSNPQQVKDHSTPVPRLPTCSGSRFRPQRYKRLWHPIPQLTDTYAKSPHPPHPQPTFFSPPPTNPPLKPYTNSKNIRIFANSKEGMQAIHKTMNPTQSAGFQKSSAYSLIVKSLKRWCKDNDYFWNNNIMSEKILGIDLGISSLGIAVRT